ncbi:hypothetical protein COEREDRAFT_11647 [Coemansia reversa NRRL 1564]|uniref:Uncharacterized protein n=1 Tax=Coemansia reversa (strain ATCC 12441 / NRRL 1564) TaxID=763665 RepID=A0A2G5B2H2_COERN|nr:hypothetical protein COEREDRAFT_11647 [Coemansia reversa NRRL 1564]|eukprot:PIA13218.1 hypothetical protein COEREDRAFT_11647 [Coemansia reversa NRRL 1564]
MLGFIQRRVLSSVLDISKVQFHTASIAASVTTTHRSVSGRRVRISQKPEGTVGKMEEVNKIKRSIQQNQFVLDNFEIPGKFQKFFTGRLRKRETHKWERRLGLVEKESELVKVSARPVVVDAVLQEKKMLMLRDQILRILEAHLSGDQLPTRLLSLQYWEITDVLVSFRLSSATCFYRIAINKAEKGKVRPSEVRRIIKESEKYLSAIVNLELAKGVTQSIGLPGKVRVRFSNATAKTKLLEQIEDEIHQNKN